MCSLINRVLTCLCVDTDIIIAVWNDEMILVLFLTPLMRCGQMLNYANPDPVIVIDVFFFSSRIIPIQISSLSQMNNSIQVGFFFFLFSEKHTRRSVPSTHSLPVAVDKHGLDFSACLAFFSASLSWSFEKAPELPTQNQRA